MRLNRSSERRGVILLVVLSLLTLFAIVGVAFVLYSDYEATSARVAREAESQQKADVDPEQALAFFLGQFIYDVNDNVTGVGSGLRGHSLARTMYGYNYGAVGVPGTNILPFSGPGRLHYTNTTAFGQDDYTLVNYTFFSGDAFLRDPERYGTRTQANLNQNAQGNSYVAANAPYTYPDLNNFFLAAMKADGTVLSPSFHRKWLFNPNNNFNDMTNANWTSAQGKYLTPRPRPNEHPQFPIPDDPTGDVKNLPWAPGGNDSIWMDLGAPVMTAPDGTQYKMLFAPLIIDLDGRINLNVAGNILGQNNTHASNQGWGPWEVNLAKVLYGDNVPPREYINLFTGRNLGASTIYGRYGVNGVPTLPGNLPSPSNSAPPAQAPAGHYPHFYGPVDFNAVNEAAAGNPSSRPAPPGYGGGSPYQCFPTFLQGYLNGGTENANHPLLFDALRSPLYNLTDDRIFRPADMEALLRPNSLTNPVDAGSSALISELVRLSPSNFGSSANSMRFRNLITALSMDLGSPGVIPYWYSTNGAPYPIAAYAPITATMATAPVSLGSAFPPVPASPPGPLPPVNNAPSEFGADWRAVSANPATYAANNPMPYMSPGGRIKMNRPLPPYPHMGSGLIPPYGAALVPWGTAYDLSGSNANSTKIINQYQSAQLARQTLANDIYRRLLMLTGVSPPTPVTPLPTDLAPRRWLAQLAVNIVDFIDEDDISTPFNFYTTQDDPKFTPPATMATATQGLDDPVPTGANPIYWVFGTELPKVVLNEVLAEAQNPALGGKLPMGVTITESVKVWLELYNTMSAPTANTQAQDGYRVPMYMTLPGGGGYSPYRVSIAPNLMTSPAPLVDATMNVLGKGNLQFPLPQNTTDVDFAVTPTMINGKPQVASNPPVTGAGVDPQNYLLIGPSPASPPNYQDPFAPTAGANPIPATTPVIRTPNVAYTPTAAQGTAEFLNGLTVMLRRLTHPYLPFQPDPTKAYYNPYSTVDYLSNVPIQANLGLLQTPPVPPTYASRGKRQPYAAYTLVTNAATPTLPPPGLGSPVVDQVVNPKGPPGGVMNPPTVTHTFGMQNYLLPSTGSYDWLVHLDRPAISPMELLHVSAWPPYMLTQRFIVPPAGSVADNNTDPINSAATKMFHHYAPWLDAPPAGATLGAPWWFDGSLTAGQQTHRLARLFEFLECGDRATGVDGLGRIPGRVNINTIWDPEILLALADANSSTGMTDANVSAIFANLLALRSPNIDPTLKTNVPGPTNAVAPPGFAMDRPFLPLSTGLVPGGGSQFLNNGVNVTQDTVLRLGPAAMAGTPQLLLFQNPNDATPPGGAGGTPAYWHPYLQTQLLTKMYNNVTTRSNTFAVFLTVGFFQVTNAAAIPPTLGAEIGRSEGRQVRHRMFAIVDRTNLSVGSTTSNTAVTVTAGGGPATVPVSFALMGGANPYTGAAWSIGAGSTLVFEPGTDNEETVMLQQPAGGPPGPPFQATFYKSHAAGVTVMQRGNPGPWTRYDPRLDPYVVPYYSLID